MTKVDIANLKYRVITDYVINVEQVTFSLACGWGGILTLASYKQFRSDIIRESYFICGVTAITAVLSGLVIFSVLGFMAESTGVSVEEVAEQV